MTSVRYLGEPLRPMHRSTSPLALVPVSCELIGAAVRRTARRCIQVDPTNEVAMRSNDQESLTVIGLYWNCGHMAPEIEVTSPYAAGVSFAFT
jgi:hypothetical protein